jgi:hypothetical protein
MSDLAEITAPEFPGDRLVVCRNPLLAAELGRKLAATETELVSRKTKPLRGADQGGWPWVR